MSRSDSSPHDYRVVLSQIVSDKFAQIFLKGDGRARIADVGGESQIVATDDDHGECGTTLCTLSLLYENLRFRFIYDFLKRQVIRVMHFCHYPTACLLLYRCVCCYTTVCVCCVSACAA